MFECTGTQLTTQFKSLIAVVQTVVVSVALPALLDATVVLTGKLSRLALRRRYIRGVCCRKEEGG